MDVRLYRLLRRLSVRVGCFFKVYLTALAWDNHGILPRRCLLHNGTFDATEATLILTVSQCFTKVSDRALHLHLIQWCAYYWLLRRLDLLVICLRWLFSSISSILVFPAVVILSVILIDSVELGRDLTYVSGAPICSLCDRLVVGLIVWDLWQVNLLQLWCSRRLNTLILLIVGPEVLLITFGISFNVTDYDLDLRWLGEALSSRTIRTRMLLPR